MSRGAPTLLVVAIAVLLVVAVAVLVPGTPGGAVSGDEPVARPPASGSWTCVVGGAGGEDDLRVVAAVPAGATAPSRVDLRQVEGGEDVAGVVDVVEPGTAVEREAVVGEGGATVHRWSGAPAVVARVWRTSAPGRPAGLVDGPCVADAGDRWVVPGLSTDGGDVAEVFIANPFATDAAVAVRLLAPTGPTEPVRLANLGVPASSTVVVNVNEVAPQRPDLAVEVEVRSGRVVVEGLLSTNAAIGGIDGLSLVPAHATPSSTWTFPWFEQRPGITATLAVANPGDEASVVGLSLQSALGGRAAPTGLVDVPGRSVRRIPLEGALDGLGTLAGLTLDVEEGGDVVAALVVRYAAGSIPAGVAEPAPVPEGEGAADDVPPPAEATGDELPRTGLAVLAGATRPATEWVLVGGPASGRQVTLQLSNPSGSPAVVDASLFTSVGAQRPESLVGLRVEPGSVRSVPLESGLLGATSTVFVVAREGTVVAGLRGVALEGPLQVTSSLGVSDARWAPVGAGRDLLLDPTLLQPDPADRDADDGAGEPVAADGRFGGGRRASVASDGGGRRVTAGRLARGPL